MMGLRVVLCVQQGPSYTLLIGEQQQQQPAPISFPGATPLRFPPAPPSPRSGQRIGGYAGVVVCSALPDEVPKGLDVPLIAARLPREAAHCHSGVCGHLVPSGVLQVVLAQVHAGLVVLHLDEDVTEIAQGRQAGSPQRSR